MIKYILRRILYAIPILFGINLITFALFFMVNSPDDMARMHLGNKHVEQKAIEDWKVVHGYDLPLFYNEKQTGFNQFRQTLFYQKSLMLFTFNFGVSDAGRDISHDISYRMWPSLAIALPTLLFAVLVNIIFAMAMAFFRSTYLDLSGVVICIILMSISSLFYIIGGQYLFGKILKWFPISGYDDGLDALKFTILPVLVAVLGQLGAGARWYRTLVLEEINKDYVKTARAKGLSEQRILFKHILKNAMLPILTGIVVIIPTLFMGSLVLESFFGVPGLGSYIIDAIQQQDFAIVRAMVFLGSVLYIIGLVLTDFSYILVDPRVRLS
ncbi:TPA: ABC transporter permease [Legionella pneumophila]|uniref:Peptide ABC transporter, permease protein n=2 Tax=Legionella pneumophila TaxID=446 RepID=Q5ZWX4_LEGPH|nr:ABC transporter permease [Legionella pneumophila]AAU27047.1 peptide ABC transporter, permease protein [Legionella pneumophila subsp. pneumophila str. Philadelphia 1]AEW51251.1 peptide ABC transporter, permease protein [Legionella pneumophila subsp. pneumophila ATCC 43290]AGN13863.1 peptide/nickel transport system permease protein [Legionella pneumophila subsp. pneumophila str. Thunder Bay]AOU04034.1 peptide ABC transporter permease [Legionella pneumophila]AOU06994.1 peptide ABC transporter 